MPELRRIYSPLPGVAEWQQDGPGENGIYCLFVHYSADPEKDFAWALRQSAPSGGMADPIWQTEMEGNPNAFSGRATYRDFHPRKNIIEARLVFPNGRTPPLEWPKWTSWDFGQTNPTVCLWWTQAPSGRLYIWREIQGIWTPEVFKRIFYEEVASYLSCKVHEVTLDDVFEDHIGDRQGKVWMQWYGMEPYAIPIRGYKQAEGVDGAEHKLASEATLNSAFASRFECCGIWQTARSDRDVATCQMPGCGKEHKAIPGLFIVCDERGEPAAPLLAAQLPTIKRATPTQSRYETPEKDEKVPHDAVDSARYGIQRTSEVFSIKPFVSDDERLMEMDPARMNESQRASLDRLIAAGEFKRHDDGEADAYYIDGEDEASAEGGEYDDF